MKRTFLFLLSVFLVLTAWAQVPSGYYDAAQGKTGAELKAALHNIIKGNVVYPYSSSSSTDVWDILKVTDQDPNNPDNVIEIYCGNSVNGAQEYNNGKGWTREHVWAKSRGDFGTDPGPGTDVHNLKPCNPTMNSLRSNRWFAECTEPVYLDGQFTGCYYSTTEWLWKPRDEVKGDVARIIFYMAVRYEGDNGEPDLEVIDSIPSDKYTTLPIHAKLSDLLKWNKEDPVDDFERHRNEVIYQYQHNRNPFIDHPEYADLIWGDTSSTSNAPTAPTNLTLTEGTSSLSLSWSDVSNEDGYYVFRSTDANYFYPIDTLPANTVDYSDTQVSEGTVYYYYVKAYNSYGVSDASNMVSGQIQSSVKASDLFFTEYVEGSSYNKALEISNFTGQDVDLGNYVIKKQTNGSGSWSNGLQLSGILHNGESFVVAHSSASQTVLDKSNLTTSATEMSFNGNDAISLWKNGTLIDIIGVFNDGSYYAKDVTMIRNADVTGPSTVYDHNQWTDYPQDYFDNLGTHTFSPSGNTTTCTVPDGLDATKITTTSADLSWNAASSAQSYDLRYRPVGSSDWTVVSVNTNSYHLTGLSSSTNYEYQVASVCSSATSDYSASYTFTTLSPSYCEPDGYTRFEWIDYVELADMSNNSGKSASGYEDNTNIVAHLTPGQTYPIYFQAGFKNRFYTEYWSVWIDFNKDGDFDDADETLAQGYTTDDALYYMNISIPSYATGQTRLRIQMNDDYYHDACYSPRYGETEDYTVDFGAKSLVNNTATAQLANRNPGHLPMLYPNPASDYVYINVTDKSRIEIYSMDGRLLGTKTLTHKQIDISDLKPGVYMLKINTDEKVYNTPLIVK